MKTMSHTPISPSILYWGTPVVLLTTLNPDNTPNISPMSSAFWLGNRCILGLDASSQTTANLERNGQVVLNLPSDDMVPAVNALAKTTGTEIVPPGKVRRGYSYVKDKFAAAGLTPEESETVRPPRVRECPVQMEAEVVRIHEVGDGVMQGFAMAIEVRVLRTWIEERLRLSGSENRVDAGKWKPMIMCFQELFGLRERRHGEERSRLAEIDEELYRKL